MGASGDGGGVRKWREIKPGGQGEAPAVAAMIARPSSVKGPGWDVISHISDLFSTTGRGKRDEKVAVKSVLKSLPCKTSRMIAMHDIARLILPGGEA